LTLRYTRNCLWQAPVFIILDHQLDQSLIDAFDTIGKSNSLLLKHVLGAFQLHASNVLIQRANFLMESISNFAKRLKQQLIRLFCFRGTL
jgi:hypothetical protein